jgi:hypothetical protein
MHTRSKASPRAQPTHFDIFLEHDPSPSTARPVFFREKLAISGVKRALGAPKVRSLVVIEKGPLADLLRAAEPPNHTDWDPKTATLRRDYSEGNHVITFVKDAVKRIVAFARSGDEKPDAGLAVDFFPKNEPGKGPVRKKAKKISPGLNPPPLPAPPPPGKPKSYCVDPEDGGFVLRPDDKAMPWPSRICVAMAYDVMTGKPFKQYDRADFDLTKKEKSGIQIAFSDGVAGYEVLAPNRVEFEISGPDFEVYVTGFDTNRDLILTHNMPKQVDGDEPEAEEEANDAVEAA